MTLDLSPRPEDARIDFHVPDKPHDSNIRRLLGCASHARSRTALNLSGHRDELHGRQHLAFQARRGPGNSHEALVVATDRSDEPSTDFELIEQRLRDVN